MRFYLLTLLALLPVAAIAKAAPCTPAQQKEILDAYAQFRSASRSGDLVRVKALSTPDVVQQIADVEKTVKDGASLARNMSFFSPALEEAKELTCETGANKARLVMRTETRSEDKAKVVAQVYSVTMFEHVNGKWLAGEKGGTNPFESQKLESLLQDKAFQLP